MFSKVLLVSLFAAVVVAAPAQPLRDQRPKREVPCTNVISPETINSSPSPSVILLNNPSAVGRIAGSQGAGNPPVINLNTPAPAASPSFINLNAPAASPAVIQLNKRQLSSLPPTSTFSFGGIVPSSAISSTLSPSSTPAANALPSFGGIVASSVLAPVSTATPNAGASNSSTSTFSSTGPDGVKTVLLLSTATVTVQGAACSSAPTFNPLQTPTPSVIASSSAVGTNIQTSPPAVLSSPGIINLNSPSATGTSAPGIFFSSVPAANVTPAV